MVVSSPQTQTQVVVRTLRSSAGHSPNCYVGLESSAGSMGSRSSARLFFFFDGSTKAIYSFSTVWLSIYIYIYIETFLYIYICIYMCVCEIGYNSVN